MNTLTLAASLAVITVAYGIVTFNAYTDDEKDAHDIFRILMRPRTPERYMPKSYFHKHGIKPATRLSTFTVRNCGNPATESGKLVSLQVTPDPIQLPGEIGVAFALDFYRAVLTPLKTSVQIKKRVLSNWITVPCIDQFGTCDYADFCEILDMIPECPQPFIDNNVPCQCPFQQGNYTLPKTQFEVDISFLPAGDYFGQLNMTMSNAPVVCYQVYLTFA
ncbi:ganglioside GM2 activator-like [Haliotis rufescens]|uniref:ganglioside GM2 activator-like n=1 Tax=Haliotis rufescens TaxID=6454 RepID=UPI00201ECFFD|nr:ganglioside GM2 activator-like [Haliotis rufescens]